MRVALSLLIAPLLAAGCASTTPNDSGLGGQGIHPQPQPNHRRAKFTAPCTPEACGEAPGALDRPHCKPADATCEWSEDEPVSYRLCPADACGEEPDAAVCPREATFRGNECGSADDGPCAWTTTCAPPRSTTPCGDPEGCGPKPDIGVVCSDGEMGDLACMQLDARCGWQSTCD